MKLETKFDFDKLNYNTDNKVHCLISATAPKVKWEKERKPVNLVVLLDVSTSMMGAKLDYTKKSAMKLVDHLGSGDKLSIVTFSHVVTTLFEPTLMTQVNKDRFKAEIEKLYSSGSTNFSGALTQGLELAAMIQTDCRVIMFTDGEPTAGCTNLEQILELMKSNQKANTTVSAFGYGDKHDSAFLTRLAELGKGNYSYIKNPDDALAAFAVELGGLLSCHAQNLVFTIMPKDNIKIEQVLTDIDVEELDGGAIRISLPDIYSEETKHLVLEVKVDKQKQALPRAVTLLDVELKYESIESKKKETESAKAKVSFVKEADAQKAANQEVLDQLALVRIGKAQKVAQASALRGDFITAQAAFMDLDLNGVSENIQGYASTSCSFVADSMSYTANKHELNASMSAAKGGRGTSTLTRRMYRNNSAQDELERAFMKDDTGTLKKDDTGNTFTLPVNSDGSVKLSGDVTMAQGPLDPNMNVVINTLAIPDPNIKITTAYLPTEEKKKLSKKRSDSRW